MERASPIDSTVAKCDPGDRAEHEDGQEDQVRAQVHEEVDQRAEPGHRHVVGYVLAVQSIEAVGEDGGLGEVE